MAARRIGWCGGVALSAADAAASTDDMRSIKAPETGAGICAQLWASLARAAASQRRLWLRTALVLALPGSVCVMLLLLQLLGNAAIADGRNGKCGCMCVHCCEYVAAASTDQAPNATMVLECFEATEERPCSPYADTCYEYDDSICGAEYSTQDQVVYCAERSPITWPVVAQVPNADDRAQRYAPRAPILYTGNDRDAADNLAAAIVTQLDAAQTLELVNVFVALEDSLESAVNLSARGTISAFANTIRTATETSGIVMGTAADQTYSLYVEPAFIPNMQSQSSRDGVAIPTLYYLLPNCSAVPQQAQDAIEESSLSLTGLELQCLDAPTIWKSSASAIDNEIYCSDPRSTCVAIGNVKVESSSNASTFESFSTLPVQTGSADALEEGSSAISTFNSDALILGPTEAFSSMLFDFKSTQITPGGALDYSMWYYNANSRRGVQDPPLIQRLNRAISAVSQAYLKLVTSDEYELTLSGIRGTPKEESQLTLDFSTLLGPLFYLWLLQALLPLQVRAIVVERENGLRSMMRVHGMRDVTYWCSQLVGHLLLYIAFVALFMFFGSIIGLGFFTTNAVAIQIILYALWGFTQLAFAAFLSTFFSSSSSATVAVSLWVFASGLFASVFVQNLLERGAQWVMWLQLVPSFALYRGLYELSQYAFLAGRNGNGQGMTWSDLGDDGNGMDVVWIMMAAEALVLLSVAAIVERYIVNRQLFASTRAFVSTYFGCKKRRDAGNLHDVPVSSSSDREDIRRSSLRDHGTLAPDIAMETDHAAQCVARLLQGSNNLPRSTPIVLAHKLHKHFAGRDKPSVVDMSLTIARGECFGMLGPNGAGKSTTIGMLTGQIRPTGGSIYINGGPMWNGPSRSYTDHSRTRSKALPRAHRRLLGVCPQHDRLWPELTAEEHLRFYARLRGLSKSQVDPVVGYLLATLNLNHSGIPTRPVRQYSGGMKRRLSVAIALLGVEVAFLDEPSTGLDPGSRRALWDAITDASRDRDVTVVLTTHSMEEAEALCDRIGMVVHGELRCLGSSRELTARYGTFMTLSLTTDDDKTEALHALVKAMLPSAVEKYKLAGTMRFDVPAKEVPMAQIFKTFESYHDGKGDATISGKGPQWHLGHDNGDSEDGDIVIRDWSIASASLEDVFLAIAVDRTA